MYKMFDTIIIKIETLQFSPDTVQYPSQLQRQMVESTTPSHVLDPSKVLPLIANLPKVAPTPVPEPKVRNNPIMVDP